jgi:hypothetical protein
MIARSDNVAHLRFVLMASHIVATTLLFPRLLEGRTENRLRRLKKQHEPALFPSGGCKPFIGLA